MNEKLLSARPTDGAAPAAGFFLAFATALGIQRQPERQRLLADRAFGALEQAGDLSRQWSLLISSKRGLLAQALTEGTTISCKAFMPLN